MNYNTSGWENTSGVDSLLAINSAAHYWPMTVFVLLVVYIVFTLTKQVTDTEEAVFLACLVFAISSIALAVISMVAWSLVAVSSLLAVITGVMMIYKNKPNTT